MSIITRVLISTSMILMMWVVLPGIVYTQGNFGLDATAESAGLKQYGGDLPTIVGNVIGTLLSMVSVLFFVLILYGGILWMTARGKTEQTEKALNTIIAATIGIVIVMGAYALTNFVFKSVPTGGGGTPQTPTTQTPTTTPQSPPADPEGTASCSVDDQCDTSQGEQCINNVCVQTSTPAP